jgi:hypothetical protein
MRLPSFQTIGEFRNPATAPALIGGGLVLMILAAWLPIVPVVTGMAMIALGSTELTLARFRDAAVFVPALVLHATTYALLYALFVGAQLHASQMAPLTRASDLAALDLAISIVPMAIAIRRISAALQQSFLSRQ